MWIKDLLNIGLEGSGSGSEGGGGSTGTTDEYKETLIKTVERSWTSEDTLEIPEGVKKVARGVYSDSQFSEIVIPKSVKSIEENAFNGTFELKKVTFKGNSAPEIANGAFNGFREPVEIDAKFEVSKLTESKINGGKVRLIDANGNLVAERIYTSGTVEYGWWVGNIDNYEKPFKLEIGYGIHDVGNFPDTNFNDYIGTFEVSETVERIWDMNGFGNSVREHGGQVQLILPENSKLWYLRGVAQEFKGESLVIPDSVTKIEHSIRWSQYIKEVTFGAGLKEWGGENTVDCPQLTHITFKGRTAPLYHDGWNFLGGSTADNGVLTLPLNCVGYEKFISIAESKGWTVEYVDLGYPELLNSPYKAHVTNYSLRRRWTPNLKMQIAFEANEYSAGNTLISDGREYDDVQRCYWLRAWFGDNIMQQVAQRYNTPEMHIDFNTTQFIEVGNNYIKNLVTEEVYSGEPWPVTAEGNWDFDAMFGGEYGSRSDVAYFCQNTLKLFPEGYSDDRLYIRALDIYEGDVLKVKIRANADGGFDWEAQ